MRKIKEQQPQFGQVDISEIKFDLKSRDEIPQLLKGLQYIYSNSQLYQEVSSLLKRNIKISKKGRRGMDLWSILVLGVIKLNSKWDYDKLKEMADNHLTLRQMLGHSSWDNNKKYALQTLRDNINLFSEDLLDQINTLIVKAGHSILKKKGVSELFSRCDSFVVETDVCYPTDINLLWTALHKSVNLIANLYDIYDISGWRKSSFHLKKVKGLFRLCQIAKHSTSKDINKQKIKNENNKKLYKKYILKADKLLKKVTDSIEELSSYHKNISSELQLDLIKMFIKDGKHQIDLIERRVFNGQKIPHDEKIFSLFERETEWISKGKAGVSQELGKRVCIIEDQFGFILSHKVMEHITDSEIAVEFVEKTKEKFSNLSSCSFDKGFWSLKNKKELEETLTIALPRKGRLSKEAKEYENSPEFKKAFKKHSAVESAINALENHGLDRCRNHGMEGFKRYISWGVLGRNIQKLGSVLIKKEIGSKIHSEKIKAGLRRSKAAA